MKRSLESETKGSNVEINCEEIIKQTESNSIVQSVQEESDDRVNQGADNEGDHKVIQRGERLTIRRQKYALDGTGSSSIEDRPFCCTNMALKVYKKAWEGARKALPRATRTRGNNSPNLDNGSSSITTPTALIDRQLIEHSDPNRTISLESEDDPATECSFEYDDDGDLRFSLDGGDGDISLLNRHRKDGADDDKPTTLRGLERLSTETEEFGENESSGGPEDVDLESFKRVYMTNFVIPEEPDKESAANQLEVQREEKTIGQQDPSTNSEGSKWRRRFRLDERFNEPNNNQKDSSAEPTNKENEATQSAAIGSQLISESDLDQPMSISDIERFVQVTCDQVMSKVREEGGLGADTDDDASVRGSGIFKVRPGLKFDDSIDSRASTDATLSTIEIPTITITEDQLDDSSVVLSEATLRDGSEYEDGVTEDGGSTQSALKNKATAIKFKVKKLGSKVKDIFKRGTTPEVSPTPSPVGEYIDMDEEKRRRKEEKEEAERKRKDEEAIRKEEADRRKREEEIERKAEVEIAKERERLKKEEAKRQKEEEKRRKEEGERLRKEEEKARKEEEKARKEEEKRMKAEEKKRREEEEKRKKEEEKMKKMKEDEEKRRIQEEEDRKQAEEERKRRIAEEEEERKRWAIEDAEKRRRWIAEEAEKTRIAFEKELERKRKQKELEEEEAERRRKREEEEEIKRKKREEELAEQRRRQEEEEEEKAKVRETLKRKLKEEATAESVKHEDNANTLDHITTSTVTVIESDHPYYDVEGVKDDPRRCSSPSLASGQVSNAMSKSTSQATIMITSAQSNRDKRSPSRDEETFGQAGESEGDIDPHMGGRKRKKMRKRLRDTKNKLINLKSKALESLPSMSSLKSRVKEILPVRSGTNANQVTDGQFNEDDPHYAIHREQKIFSEYRKRYPDSENEFFSDSELVESRKSTLKAMPQDLEAVDLYDDIDTTEDRVQMLLSPINSPLRPPRKSDYGAGGMGSSFHTSEPNISRTGTPKKPKRAPPPRPPLPEVDVYLVGSTMLNPSVTGSTATSLGALDEIDLTSSNRDLSGSFSTIKKEPEKIPASIYYRKVVRDWQERHLKKIEHEMVSASSPNLETYQRPPRPGRHPPRIPPLPLDRGDRPRPIPRRKLSRTGSLRQKMIEQQKREELGSTLDKENTFDGYEVLGSKRESDRSTLPGHSGLPPLPPPRLRVDRLTPIPKSPYSTLHRRQIQLQQQQQRQIQHDYLLTADRANLATDGLYWKPFSWKTGRCRSLTELYVRKRTQTSTGPLDSKLSDIGSELSLSQEPIERSLSYRLMSQYCSPPRPPPPTIKTDPPSDDLSKANSPVDGQTKSEPIYSTIDRTKKLKRDLKSELLNGTIDGDTLMQNRPLPAPPLPPRSKRKNSASRSRSNSPYLSLTNSSVDLSRPDATYIRPVSPYPMVGMVDVSVETGSQLVNPSSLESKECQTSLEDIEDKQSMTVNKNNLRPVQAAIESRLTVESVENYVDDDGRESITPTPTTIPQSTITKSQVAIKVTPEREVILIDTNRQGDLITSICNPKRTRLSSSSSKDSSPPLVTASSGPATHSVPKDVSPGRESDRLDDEPSNRTITSYYDAEECDTDMDTFADLDSLSTEATATLTASTQFHSVYSEPITTISSTTETAVTSQYDTDEGDSKTMEVPCPPTVAAPGVPPPAPGKEGESGTSIEVNRKEQTSCKVVPLVAEHVTIEEDSDDDMLQPRVASPSEMRAYISRRRMRPDSMDASDSEW